MPPLPDYSTRIISQGGATTGTGALNMYASTIGLVATNGVGIGTTVPSAALHVASGLTSDLGNGLKTKYTNIGVTAASAVALNTVYFGTFSGSGPYTFTTNSAGGYGLFAIAYATPGTVYQISVTCYSSNVTSFSITDNNSVVHLVSPLTSTPTTYTTQGYANSNSVIYIGIVTPAPAVGLAITFSSITVQRLDTTATGNVGIGVAAPYKPLHISGSSTGDISALIANTNAALASSASLGFGLWSASGSGSGTTGFAGQISAICMNAANGNTDMAFSIYTGSSVAPNYTLVERMRITSTGNVGIGTTVPLGSLHSHGSGNQLVLSNSSDVNCQLLFSVDTAGNTRITCIQQGVANRNIIPYVDAVNYFGVGTNRWAGIYAANGTIQTSDTKEKDSAPLIYGLNEVLQMRTILYKWKSQANLPDDAPEKNFQYYGFCADELSPIFPELVYNEDPATPVQMNYSELLPVIVNAIKEQNSAIVSLDTKLAAENTELKSAIALLEARLAALESK